MWAEGMQWKNIQDCFTPPPGYELERALLTTYDAPDTGLLIEQVLPNLFGLDYYAVSESESGRIEFYETIKRRLVELKGKFVIVSSADSGKAPSQKDGWLLRLLPRLQVGERRTVTQHAKLWLLAWRKQGELGPTLLDVVISSANLTLDGFKNQIQGGWQMRTQVAMKPDPGLSDWGVLPEFIRKLFVETGSAHYSRLFVELLSRAASPGGVHFVASVPGQHTTAASATYLWGWAGLRRVINESIKIKRPAISMFVPYCGTWQHDEIHEVATFLGTEPKLLDLVWIRSGHPWETRWSAPAVTLKTLNEAKVQLRELPVETADKGFLHKEQHRDTRWSHAKLYHIRSAKRQFLLITSANFSPSAWGMFNGNQLEINNFELGVAVESSQWPFFQLERLDANEAATGDEQDWSEQSAIWSEAAWDGATLRVRVRAKRSDVLQAHLALFNGKEASLAAWRADDVPGVLLHSRALLDDGKAGHTPVAVILQLARDRTLHIPVLDLRDYAELRQAPVPNVEEAAAARVRDAQLLAQYGVPIPTNPSPNLPGRHNGASTGVTVDYRVEAIEQARQLLASVDCWHQVWTKSIAQEIAAPSVLADGYALADVFSRMVAERQPGWVGAMAAAEEMRLHLARTPGFPKQ